MSKNLPKDLYQNPLELTLDRSHKKYPYSLKLIDIYPVYCFEKQKYICYRKELKEEQKLLIIQEHIDSPTYIWRENAYFNTISLYYFMNIKKNQERTASLALSKGIEDSYLWWNIWGVLEDGTILSPTETRRIIKLSQNNTIESNVNDSLEELNDYLSENTNIDFWDERGCDEL